MKKIKLLILTTIILSFSNVFSQGTTSKGTDFWLGFMAHINGTGSSPAEMDLYITSDSNTTGTVSIPGQAWSTTFTIVANIVTVVSIPNTTAYIGCTDCIQNRGIRVTSVLPVALYAHIHRDYRSDATLVLPTGTAGKEYRVMTWSQESANSGNDVVSKAVFMIVASSDNTKIRITPETSTVQRASGAWVVGTPYNITLNRGEIYQGMAPNRYNDLTGTLIEVIDTGVSAACKKIAVFSGNTGTTLGNCGGFTSKDNLYEQLFPVNSWSTDFLTVPQLGRTFDRFRVLAGTNNTVVTVNGGFAAILSKGQFFQSGNVSTPQYITSNNPISVAQFSTTQSCGGTGDPSMIMLSPIQQTLKDIVVYSSEFEAITANYINVVIQSKDTATFTLNGSRVPFTRFIPLPSYAYARIKVPKGNQRLLAAGGFNATAYGFGSFESYGYNAGANVTNLAAYITLADKNKKPNNLNTLCLGEVAEFTGIASFVASKYNWNFGDGNTDTLKSPKHTYKSAGDYRVKLTVTKKTFDGCSSTDSAELLVKVASNPRASFTFQNACDANVVKFFDSVEVDTPGNLVFKLWDYGDGAREFASNPTHLYDTVGKYITNLFVRSSFDCYDTATHEVERYPVPVAKFAASGSCFKDSLLISDSSSVKLRKIAKWVYDFGDGTIDSFYAPYASYLYNTYGNFKVVLTVTDSVGCKASKDTTITKHPPFKAGFSFNDACLKNTVNFLDTSNTTSITPSAKIWHLGDGNTSNAANPAYKYASSGSYNAKLVIRQNADCADSVTHNVKIFNQVQSAVVAQNLCFGDSGTLTQSHAPSTEILSKIDWYFGGADSFKGKTIKTIFKDSGRFNYNVITTTANGCKDTLATNVYIIPKPKADFSSNIICLNNAALMKSTSNHYGFGINSYNWSSTSGRTANLADSFKFTSNATGVDNITLIINSGAGCKDTITKPIFVWSLPNISFTGTNVCLNLATLFTNNSTVDTGSINAWAWDFGGGATSIARDPSYTYSSFGTKNISLTATTTNGCKASNNSIIEVYPLPTPNFTVVEDCEALPTTLTNTSSVSSGTISVINWELGDGNTNAGNNIAHTYAVVGSYNVKMSIETNRNCKAEITKTVKSHAIPVVDFTFTPDKGCAPLAVMLTSNATVANDVIAVYDWKVNGANAGNTSNANTVLMAPRKYSASLYVESAFGCDADIEYDSIITVFDKPTADFSMSPIKPTIIEPDVDFTDLSIGALTWDWTFGETGKSNIQNPKYSFMDTGRFRITLIISNENLCTDTSSKTIFIEPAFSVYIPNSFSPNGDGINEIFKLSGVLQGVKGYEITIFNRWGEILFATKDVNKGWDGTYQGKPVQEGFYNYSMRYTDYFVSKWYINNNTVYLMR